MIFVPRLITIAMPIIIRNRKGSIHDSLIIRRMIASRVTAVIATHVGRPEELPLSFLYFISF